MELTTALSADECLARLDAATFTGWQRRDWRLFRRDTLDAQPFSGWVNGPEFCVWRFWPGSNRAGAHVQGRVVAAGQGARIELAPKNNTAGLAIFVLFAVLMVIPAAGVGSTQGVLVGIGFVALAVVAAAFGRRQAQRDLQFIDRTLRDLLQAG